MDAGLETFLGSRKFKPLECRYPAENTRESGRHRMMSIRGRVVRRMIRKTRREGDRQMRFLCVHKGPEGAPPTLKMMEDMGKLISEMSAAGVLLATEGCLPSAKGARVRRSNGKITVTDGPFTESKEVIGGFALIQVTSKDEAIEWTKRFINVVGEGESEVRELCEVPAYQS
jgi:hypothetical protein